MKHPKAGSTAVFTPKSEEFHKDPVGVGMLDIYKLHSFLTIQRSVGPSFVVRIGARGAGWPEG